MRAKPGWCKSMTGRYNFGQLHDQLGHESERRSEDQRKDAQVLREGEYHPDRHDVDRDPGEGRCGKAMARVEHGTDDACEARGDDARHQAARHIDRQAELVGREPVRDDGHVIWRADPAEHGEQRQPDREQVENRARQPRDADLIAARDEVGKDRDECADERTVENAEEDRRDGNGREKCVHFDLGPEETGVDDLPSEAEQTRKQRRAHDHDRRAGERTMR
jgi:hypothetical protein